MSIIDEAPERLSPAQVAALFHVDPKTVTRWAKAGKLTFIRTPGGHRRYRADEVLAMLGESSAQPEPLSTEEVAAMLRRGATVDQLITAIRGGAS